MTPEQDENVKKWLAALRSGEYNQATGSLIKVSGEGDELVCKGYCCLGVAGKVLGLTDRQLLHTGSNAYELIRLGMGLREGLGYYNGNDVPAALFMLNDTLGKDFNFIADVIESRPAGLFTD